MVRFRFVDHAPDRAVIEEALPVPVISIERLSGGRNARTYRIVCADGRCLAAKLYHRSSVDRRDRLATEFGALVFLWQHGIAAIPKPIAIHPSHGLGIYAFVDGSAVDSRTVEPADIDEAADFLASLDELRSRRAASRLRCASEACFTVAQTIESIEARLQRLAGVSGGAPLHGELRQFLEHELLPSFVRTRQWACQRLEEIGFPADRILSPNERTLSPSDFGFHNAIRQKNGRLAFVDFEYFGWDDPAKTIADFLLHPGMETPSTLRSRLARRLLGLFDREGWLRPRLDVMLPLLAIKWCLILLNEFVPESQARRDHAATTESHLEHRCACQLAKARSMLAEARNNHDDRRLWR
ncbi:MAG: phosphotransferase [Pseudomonadota bacterium]